MINRPPPQKILFNISLKYLFLATEINNSPNNGISCAQVKIIFR